ncbi:MAG: FkbM family methyltransferase [Planctomycetia bacterium]|nr:FkbM family methyltransferase [Planctomycetia bacterium]
MSTPTTQPIPSPTPEKPTEEKKSFFRLPRREFFVGGLAGLIAGKAASWVQPMEWTQKELPDGTKFSFAQFGEDLVASSLFASLKIDKPSYLDIGAYEPIRSNNTYLFHRRGARGVLVEPNVALTSKLQRKRPGDTVLVAGIGVDETPEADYFVLSDDELNTFDKDQADRLTRETTTKLLKVVKMPLLNINRVIAEHFGGSAPDFLSIDIEGMDFAVLRTLDYARFRPKVICAETLITATTRHNPETLALMAEKGYELRGMTLPNTLFVDKRALGA